MHKTDHHSELLSISKLLAENPIPVPYTVPTGYFDHFSSNIIQRIKALDALTAAQETAALSPLLSGLSRQMPHTLPDTYFRDLAPGFVLAGMNGSQHADTASPLLESLRGKKTYQLPPDYFARLSGEILEKVTAAPEARVVSIGFGRKIMRYAAAACIAAVVAASGWLFWQHQQPGTTPDGAMAGIKKATSKELQDFIDENTVVYPDNSRTVASEDIKAEDVKTMLAGVPDDELQQYLEQQPNLKDLTLTNVN